MASESIVLGLRLVVDMFEVAQYNLNKETKKQRKKC